MIPLSMEPPAPALAAPSHVGVYVRLRPPRGGGSGSGGGGGVTVSQPLGGGAAEVHLRAAAGTAGKGGLVDHTARGHAFSFDGVLPGGATQAQVYDVCVRELANGALAGVSGAVLAYGQTGAGKTFTMTGTGKGAAAIAAAGAGGHQLQDARAGWGMMPRALAHVLSSSSPASAAAADGQPPPSAPRPPVTVRMSYLEIYKDRLIDLLAPPPPQPPPPPPPVGKGGDDSSSECGDDDSDSDDGAADGSSSHGRRATARLRLMEDAHGRVYVRGQRTPVVRDEAQGLALLAAGDAARAVAEHALNAASSRSHAVLTLYIEQAVPTGGALPPGAGGSGAVHGTTVLLSKLHLVDLAGSERVKATRSEGGTLQEARYINQSLGLLEQVVLALSSGSSGGAGGDGDAARGTPPAPPRVAFGSGRAASTMTTTTTTQGRSGRGGTIGAPHPAPPVVLGWQDLPPPGAARTSSSDEAAAGGDDAAPALAPARGGSSHTGSVRPHVPYRRSKLTFLLKDALGGGCRTRLIAAVWPEAEHAGNTLSTLRFAARMRNVAVRPTYHTLQDGGGGGAGALSARAAQRLREGYEAQLAALRAQLTEAQAANGPAGAAAAGGAGGGMLPTAPAAAAAVDAINALTPAQRTATLAAVPAFLAADTPDFLSRLNGFTAGQAFLALLLARQTLLRATAGGVAGSGGAAPAATAPPTTPEPAATMPVEQVVAVATVPTPSLPSPQLQLPAPTSAPAVDAATATADEPVTLADTSALDRAIDAAQAREAAFDAWRAPGGGGADLQRELRAAKAALSERKGAHGAAVAQVEAAKVRLSGLGARLRALQQQTPLPSPAAAAERAAAKALAREYVGAKAELAAAVTAVAEARADVEHLRACAAGIACEMEARFTEESAK